MLINSHDKGGSPVGPVVRIPGRGIFVVPVQLCAKLVKPLNRPVAKGRKFEAGIPQHLAGVGLPIDAHFLAQFVDAVRLLQF